MENCKLSWNWWNVGNGRMVYSYDFDNGYSVHVECGLLTLSNVDSSVHWATEREYSGNNPYALLTLALPCVDLYATLSQYCDKRLAKAIVHDIFVLVDQSTTKDRAQTMTKFISTVTAAIDQYTQGLITDLETLRQLASDALYMYERLNCCTTCGAANKGHHKEVYGGILCPGCNHDKREYMIVYSLGYDRPSVQAYHHELTKQEGISHEDVHNTIDAMEQFSRVYLSSASGRIMITRLI